MPLAPKPSSPCTKVCVLDDASGLCRGCGRTRDEIAAWGVMPEARRRTIMAGLEARMRAGPSRGGSGRVGRGHAGAMIYLGLGAIALVVAALVLSDGSDSVGGVIEPDHLAGLAWTGGTLILVVAGFWRQFNAAVGANLRALAAWAMIGVALVLGYSHRDRIAGVGARVLGEIRPGSATSGADGTVTITRRADGAFRVEAAVNGRGQPFLFDTGASSVVLTAENAAALGITPTPADFTARVSTANGIAFAAPIQLDSLAVGTIVERRVDAMVVRPGSLTDNLLGQSFLSRLSGYAVRGDRLILSPP